MSAVVMKVLITCVACNGVRAECPVCSGHGYTGSVDIDLADWQPRGAA